MPRAKLPRRGSTGAGPAEPEAQPVTHPLHGGRRPCLRRCPIVNPVEAGPAVAPTDENGNFDTSKIADPKDFGDWEEQGCRAKKQKSAVCSHTALFVVLRERASGLFAEKPLLFPPKAVRLWKKPACKGLFLPCAMRLSRGLSNTVSPPRERETMPSWAKYFKRRLTTSRRCPYSGRSGHGSSAVGRRRSLPAHRSKGSPGGGLRS